MKKLFLGVFIFFIPSAFALANLGLTTLVFPEKNDYIVMYESHPELSPIQQSPIDKEIVQSLLIKLNTLNNNLLIKRESGTKFKLFNAEANISEIQKTQPNFLDTIKAQEGVVENDEENSESGVNGQRHNIPKTFFLMAYVTKISHGQILHKITASQNISWLYSLDVTIKYKIVDATTLKPIAEFMAIGHGGVAKILPDGRLTVKLDAVDIVDEVITNLTNNIWHELLIKELPGKP